MNPHAKPPCSKPDAVPRRCAGQCSSVSGIPAAHTPPIPMPKSARSAKRGREAAEKRKDRQPENRQHQRQLASPAVGHRAGHDATHEPHDERHGPECSSEHGIDRKCPLDVDQDERQDGEVEAIEHPAEERRGERTPLVARERAESVGGWWLVVGDHAGKVKFAARDGILYVAAGH